MRKLLTGAIVGLIAIVVSACANGVPSASNMGYVYTKTVSACRSDGAPNDPCVQADLNKCKALVDMANPGRDESTYMAVINTLTGIAGTAAGYELAGYGMTAVQAPAGSYIGQGIGTAVGYNSTLYRSSVEACMFSLGRDPKLVEQYFGLAAYFGPKVVDFDRATRSLEKRGNEAPQAANDNGRERRAGDQFYN